MMTKHRLTNYFLILAPLILGMALAACSTTATAVAVVEPASVDIIDETVTEPTAEPAATPELEEKVAWTMATSWRPKSTVAG